MGPCIGERLRSDSTRIGLAGAGHAELGSLVQKRLRESWVKPVGAWRLVGKSRLGFGLMGLLARQANYSALGPGLGC